MNRRGFFKAALASLAALAGVRSAKATPVDDGLVYTAFEVRRRYTPDFRVEIETVGRCQYKSITEACRPVLPALPEGFRRTKCELEVSIHDCSIRWRTVDLQMHLNIRPAKLRYNGYEF